MPGNIHVSVLELVGLPTPPQSSSMCIKVSMGKQEHAIQENQETSIPLATLRDNLNVSIHDSEGNEIAHTDVKTRSIVEKVMWDDFFPLKGGGNIHMRLHFILSEDEQDRIRSMRESAARKKHEEMKRRHSSADLGGASGGSYASSYDSLKSWYKTHGRSLDLSGTQDISSEPDVKSLNQTQPGQMKQPEQVLSTSKSTGLLDELPDFQQSKGRIHGQDAQQQNQLDKTHSNEEESPATNKTCATAQSSSSTTADIPPKPTSFKKAVVVDTQSDLYKFKAGELGKERKKLLSVKETAEVSGNSTVDTPPGVLSLKETVAADTKPVLSELEDSPAPTSEEKEKEVGDLLPSDDTTKELATRLRSDSEVDTRSNETVLQEIDAVNSEIPDEKNTSEAQPTEEEHKEKNSLKRLFISPLPEGNIFSFKKILQGLPKRKRNRTNSLEGKEGSTTSDSFVIDKKWRSKRWRPCQRKAKPKVSHENEYCSSNSWIFLDETISSCVQIDDRPFVDVQEGCRSNYNRDDDQEKLTDTDVTQSKSEKDSSGSNISFPGPAGQAVKIAIMVGFGLLVLFTRQKK